jgi:glycosidase
MEGLMVQSELRISKDSRLRYAIREKLFSSDQTIGALYQQAQRIAAMINAQRADASRSIKASELYAVGIIRLIQREVIEDFSRKEEKDLTDETIQLYKAQGLDIGEIEQILSEFFPSMLILNQGESARITVEEMLLLEVSQLNPAVMTNMPDLFDNSRLKNFRQYEQAVDLLLNVSKQTEGVGPDGEDLFSFLCTPARISPHDLAGQLNYILSNWKQFVQKYANALMRALDFIQEENRPVFPPGPGPAETTDFSTLEHEYEAFSADSDWMPNVVMIAKSTLVWLDQLSKEYGTPIRRLDEIPDREIDVLRERGFTTLWLIGVWERSRASKRIKNKCGNPEAEASAYSLYGYEISGELGGWDALDNLRSRCQARGIRLASDMVPNHTGLDSEWMNTSPQLFLQSDHSPFPSYDYDGENLSNNPDIGIYLDNHYYDQTDAAVTFKRVDFTTGETRYIYHGNDGTGMPWNDTAQLDYLNPETRRTVIDTIVHVAKNFPVIRFDAAMTLAKKHIQRLWYPLPGTGGDIPSRSAHGLTRQEFDKAMPAEFWREVVDTIAEQAPDTLLLAEAFWMMEGYFVRTLGMHRVYNSAFMNMLKNEENRKYRDTIKNTISFDPEILKRYVNFMNNPDEDTAVAQFGDGDKYFGVCTLLITMPGLPMFGHGQIEGYREKYGMEFKKAYWNERPDQYLVGEHYRRIFPLAKKRYLFSHAENFNIYDVIESDTVAEHVFAYTNSWGTEHALVFYNNTYQRAAGWINESAPVLKRQSEEERSLVTTTIGEALNLTNSHDYFFLCRGFHDGLTYLRSSKEVCDRGLFTMLNGYETQVYLDFYEIEDRDGTYARLCERLNGAGSRDIDRDLKRIRYRDIHSSAEMFYDESTIFLMKQLCRSEDPETLSRMKQLLLPVLLRVRSAWGRSRIAPESGLPQHLEPGFEQDVISALSSISHLSARMKHDKILANGMKIMPELPVVLLEWVLLLPVARTLKAASMEIPDMSGELLIDEHIREPLRERSVPSEEAQRIASAAVIMHAFPDWYDTTKTESQMLEQILAHPVVRSFTRMNWSRDIQWYHKESMQECLYYLYLSHLLNGKGNVEEASQVVLSWFKKEMFASYRVENLLK